MRRFLILGIVLSAGILAAFSLDDKRADAQHEQHNSKEAPYEPIVVLELFTSQGCSSCPAADRLLKEVKQLHPKNVFTLSYHVDYWNYIGWKDPFSKKIYSNRQSNYNKKLGYRGNYTPEIVVNGKTHFTGSNRAKMNEAITSFKGMKVENSARIIKFEQKDNSVVAGFEIEGNIDNKKLRAVLVLDERTTEVKRGENRNRTIRNANIVVAENELRLTNAKGEIEVELPTLLQKNEDVALILLVSNTDLDITAAVKTDFTK